MPSLRGFKKLAQRHVHFVGPGLVSAVAYIDPGNWATDLQAGATYGYKLLFVVLLAGLAAVVLQTLSVRLGATTATSLPHQTRKLFLRLEAKHPKYRVALHCGLWTLYILAEIAIIATDLAELLGSAIALNLLFPKLPLWAGVLVTAVDVLIVLAFFNSSKGRQGMMFFEILIVSLVLAVFVSFMILLKLVRPDWGDVFYGFVPSKTLIEPGALYIGVGIIGATVMPHALFLGSSLAGVDRLNMQPQAPEPERNHSYKEKLHRLPALLKLRRQSSTEQSVSGEYELDEIRSQPVGHAESSVQIETEQEVRKDVVQLESGSESAFEHAVKLYEAEMRTFDRIRWVDIHLRHATVDTIFSLLGFALTINSSILILAGAAFYYNPDATGEPDIQGAFHLMKSFLSNGAAICFAVALLCAGQSASITATLAGQVVSEGFINWRTNPAVRRMVTRLISSIPAATVAAAVGGKGLNTMLVASQVVLSIILPTVIFPLVFLCSKDDVMTVEAPVVDEPTSQSAVVATRPAGVEGAEGEHVATSATRSKSYKSPKWITFLGYLLFAIVVVANAYVIVELGLGNA